MDERRLQIIIEARNKGGPAFDAAIAKIKELEKTQINSVVNMYSSAKSLSSQELSLAQQTAVAIRQIEKDKWTELARLQREAAVENRALDRAKVLSVKQAAAEVLAANKAEIQAFRQMQKEAAVENRAFDRARVASAKQAAAEIATLKKSEYAAFKLASAEMIAGNKLYDQNKVDQAKQAAAAMIESQQRLMTSTQAVPNVFATMGSRVTTIMQNMASQVGEYFGIIRGMFIRLAAISGLFAAGAAIKGIIGASTEIEAQRAVLEALTGSYKKAGDIITWVREKAKGTPFEVPGLIEMVTQLRSVGLSYKRWFDPIGNLAMMSGRSFAEGIEMATRAIARLKSGATGEALELLRRMKVTRTDFQNQGIGFSKGGELQGSPSQAVEALYNIIQTKFPGVMDKMKGKAKSTFSDIRDYVRDFALEIAGVGQGGELLKGGLFSDFKNSVAAGLSWLRNNKGVVKEFAKSIGDTLKTAFDLIKTYSPIVITTLATIVKTFSSLVKSLLPVLKWMILVWGATKLLGVAFVVIRDLLAVNIFASLDKALLTLVFRLQVTNMNLKALSFATTFASMKVSILSVIATVRELALAFTALALSSLRFIATPLGAVLVVLGLIAGAVIKIRNMYNEAAEAARKFSAARGVSDITKRTPWTSDFQRAGKELTLKELEAELSKLSQDWYTKTSKGLLSDDSKKAIFNRSPDVINLRTQIKALKEEIIARTAATNEAIAKVKELANRWKAANKPMTLKQSVEWSDKNVSMAKDMYGDVSPEYEKSLKDKLAILKKYYAARYALFAKEKQGSAMYGTMGLEVWGIAEDVAQAQNALQDLYKTRKDLAEKAYKEEVEKVKERRQLYLSQSKELLDFYQKTANMSGIDVSSNLANQRAAAEDLLKRSMYIASTETKGNPMWKSAIDDMIEAKKTIAELDDKARFGDPLILANDQIEIARTHLEIAKSMSNNMGAVRSSTIEVIAAERVKLSLVEKQLEAYLAVNDTIKASSAGVEIAKIKADILDLQKSMRTNLEDEFKKMAQMIIGAPANLQKGLARSGIALWQRQRQAFQEGIFGGAGLAFAGAGAGGASAALTGTGQPIMNPAKTAATNVNVYVTIDGEQLASKVTKSIQSQVIRWSGQKSHN